MRKNIISSLILILLISTIALPQSPLERLKRSVPGNKSSGKETDNSPALQDYSQSPARSEIDGVKTILSNLRIRSRSPRWNDERYVREYGDYIQRAEKYIAAIKQKDPSFDVSPLEQGLRPYKDAYGERGAALASKDAYFELARKKYSIAGQFPSPTARLRFENKRDIENLLQTARDLDYPATRAKLEEGVRQFRDLAEDYNAKKLLEEFPSAFDVTAQNFISESNRLIELAYQTQSKNRTQAASFAESAAMLVEVVLTVAPANTGAIALKKDSDAAMEKISGALAASVYTSAFHKTNAGKIVFFNSPQQIKQVQSTAVASEFKAGDHIYAIVYLKGALKDIYSAPNRDVVAKLGYRVYLDGTEHVDYGGFPAGITWDQYSNAGTTYLLLDIVPDPEVIDYPAPRQYDSVIKLARLLGQSSPRRHRIEIKFDLGEVAASGAFEIDNSTGQEKLLAIAAALHKEKISKVFLPKAAMANAALQQSMTAALKSNGWKQQMLRVAITDSQWQIHRNALGAIIFRSIGAAVAMKETNGTCRYFTLSFKQAYRGGGYGQTEQYGVGNNFEMACENVNK